MIDVHCHLDQLHDKVNAIVKSQELCAVISSGIRPGSWQEHIQLAREHRINISLGLHPFFVNENFGQELESLESLLGADQLVAIGETGLDYHRETLSDRQAQKDALIRQLGWAESRQLPVIVHCRKAFDDFWKIVQPFDVSLVFHAFSGGPDDLKKALARHAMISFGFPMTYENNKKQQQMLRETPLEHIVFETDAPYMASTPLDIGSVYRQASILKHIERPELVSRVRQNVGRTWKNMTFLSSCVPLG